jgi:hypothetical protein
MASSSSLVPVRFDEGMLGLLSQLNTGLPPLGAQTAAASEGSTARCSALT